MRRPPGFVSWLLERLLEPQLFKGIYGDLLEDYHTQQQTPKWRADLQFLFSGLGFVRFPILFKKKRNETSALMSTWKNYFKISFRNLKKNKGTTAISLIGLVVSFTSSLAILQYVQFEKSYDNFHEEQLYRVTHEMTSSATTSLTATTFYGAKDDFLREIPGIKAATHIAPAGDALLRIGDRAITQPDAVFASPSVFELFNYPISEGRIFDEKDVNSIAISRAVADRLFPDGNAMDQTIEIDGLFGSSWNPKVVMVFEDLPLNTHIRAEIVFPMQKMMNISQEEQFFGGFTFEQVRWLWLSFHTYLVLDDASQLASVESKANEMVAEKRRDRNALLNQNHEVFLQPVETIHTTAGIGSEISPINDLNIINLFAVVAVCILIIGWINYINLSTARSINRGKEVGIRKVLGSSMLQLKTQFQVEAFLINMMAFVLSLGLLLLVAPVLEGITGVAFFDTFSQNYILLVAALLTVIVGSFLSGFYPSHILANFKSIEVLKGKLRHSSGGVMLRRVLVGIQFAFTLFLMSGLMIVHNQMSYMLDHDLGVDIDRTLIINSAPEAAPEPAYTGKVASLKNELANLAGVSEVAVATAAPGMVIGWRVSTEDSESERSGVFVQRALVDHDYFDLYGINLVAGRLFEREYGSETTNIIANVNATQRLGFAKPEEALGYDMAFAGEQYKVVGVVDDFYQRGVQFAIEPMVFNLDTALVGNFISVKVENDQLAEVLPQIENQYQTIFPRAPFESQIVEDIYVAQYESEQRFRTLFSLFTSIASTIAILGLLGLASYILNQRLKEVCVRKVLGAKSSNLFMILNKEYFLISLASFIIAVPLAVYLMQGWLDDFENRIQLQVIYFLLPFITTLGIILITTVNQTLNVINSNPAKILKEDD